MSSLGLITAAPLNTRAVAPAMYSLSVPIYTGVPIVRRIEPPAHKKQEGETDCRPNLISQLKTSTPLHRSGTLCTSFILFLRELISIPGPEVVVKHIMVVVVLMITSNTSGGSIGTRKYHHISLGSQELADTIRRMHGVPSYRN